jgi:hypothetical protein
MDTSAFVQHSVGVCLHCHTQLHVGSADVFQCPAKLLDMFSCRGVNTAVCLRLDCLWLLTFVQGVTRCPQGSDAVSSQQQRLGHLLLGTCAVPSKLA